MTNEKDFVSGAMLRGAFAKWFNKGKTLADNPFPDTPGSYTLRKAWAYGFENSGAVLAEHDGESPNDEAYRELR